MTDAERLRQLAMLVRDVRAAQKRYFRERTTDALTASKSLESKLDRMAADVLDAPAPSLFQPKE